MTISRTISYAEVNVTSPVDGNADCCNHHDGDAGHLARRDQAAHTLNRYRANRHQKEHGIGERGQNGAAPQTIGVSL